MLTTKCTFALVSNIDKVNIHKSANDQTKDLPVEVLNNTVQTNLVPHSHAVQIAQERKDFLKKHYITLEARKHILEA